MTIKLLFSNNHFISQSSEQIGGAWITNILRLIGEQKNIKLTVVCRGNKYETFTRNKVKFITLPVKWYDKELVSEKYIERVLKEESPDILHIEGTEMAFSADLFSKYRGRAVISLQGLIEGISQYELAGLQFRQNLQFLSFKSALNLLILYLNFQFRFKRRLKKEKILLKNGKYFIGRTLWDKSHLRSFNAAAKYYDCPRIISDEFLNISWIPDGKEEEKKVVFIGNCSTPRKGLHIALKALLILRRKYPKIIFRIAGHTPSRKGFFRYLDFVRVMITKMKLHENVEFLGPLDREKMSENLSECDLYLIPSLIENSPNTLAEAMMVGVPIVAASAGGIPSMVIDDQEALLYRPEDYKMAAYQIERILESNELAANLAASAKNRALLRHDEQKILSKLMFIYEQVLRG